MKERKEVEIEEQTEVLKNDKKNMIVSASAGSGKTFVMIKYITDLVANRGVPLKDLVVLTFTKAAAAEMKERLEKSLREKEKTDYIVEQIDNLPTANISTIDSFCEKSLKKYANLVGLNESFSILDENLSTKLKIESFDAAFTRFKEENADDYINLLQVFKHNTESIREIVFSVENLVDAVSDKDEFLKKNLENAQDFFDEAARYLLDDFKNEAKTYIKRIENLHLVEYSQKLQIDLSPVFKSEDIFKLSKLLSDLKLTPKPNKNVIGEETSELIDRYKKIFDKRKEEIKNLNLLDPENAKLQREGVLEKSLLRLFVLYQDVERQTKLARNVLCFSDLSHYMTILSEKEDLFSGVQYVFVDEYQDTNKVHERIIKNVAKNCKFVAVGDVKQGIYGFRLADSEIFLRDVKNFDADKDSNVKYLKKNFRSDKRILDFVNDIFKKCMIEDFTGVDYLENSMLNPFEEMQNDGSKAVTIRIVKEDEKEKSELPKIYSVKNAEVSVNESDLKQLLDIKNHILKAKEMMIYDDKKFRKCEYADIAILSRNRTPFYRNLEMFLTEHNIPVGADVKRKLSEEVEIKVLLNFMKVALLMEDDIALLSVLLSPLCGFSLETIIDEKGTQTICEMVQNNQIFASVIKKIEDFNKNCVVFGVRKAFEKLFSETQYRAYLNTKENFRSLNELVDTFLLQIEESGFEFDLPGLINYFETVDIAVESQSVEGGVVLETIHASKGLEYPVVFLIDCDKDFMTARNENSNVKINERFGFAVKDFDTEENTNSVSVRMQAVKNLERKKRFSEEMMIFYVALTRAKNKLFLFGKYEKDVLDKNDISMCRTYFDLIFYALDKAREKLLETNEYSDQNVEMAVVENVESQKTERGEAVENRQFNEDDLKKIKDYLDFEYKYDDKLNFKLKEGVTELNTRDVENKLERFSNDDFSFVGAGVEIGNAYHFALEHLDFDKIESEGDIKKQFKEKSELFEEVERLVDTQTVLKNILLVKQVANGGKLYKERKFIMKEKLCNLLENVEFDDEILLQGVVDLFIIKDQQIILIDYKYSNSASEKYLIDKYKNQIKYYKIAIESAIKMPVKEAYLLSLKHSKLIKVEI